MVVFASKVSAGCYHSDNYESNGETIPQVSICTLDSCEAVSYVTMCGNVHGIFGSKNSFGHFLNPYLIFVIKL